MRIDIKHLIAKGTTKKLVEQIRAYASLMASQGKPRERVIVSTKQHDTLMKLVSRQAGAVLCCGEALVYFNHDPIDESGPVYAAKPRFDAGLPPVEGNPFGLDAPVKPTPGMHDYISEYRSRCSSASAGRWDRGMIGIEDDDAPF